MAETLAAIRRLTVNGVPPSIQTLADACGIRSRGSFPQMLERMRDRALIIWEPNKAHTLRIVDQGPDYETMPTAQLMRLNRRIEAVLADRCAA
ncbi:MAG: hypothetical protein Q8N10_03410 [Phenylobacterium sp.]|uniref:hypothetical protein n=1 Tax=Phenylobacterium sp. TaxID=1871053 RepID=UPI00271BFFB2|nr:hypothetical protein [Phenylobacterium sp.]MDO8912318.1 hypothetical protein [Phenylobacterium sp.]MDP3099530.1 hypothetical protein [Phenylobacterium sp.]